MLVLERRRDESIVIGDDVVLTVLEIRGNRVRLGITAPVETPVNREEIHAEIERDGTRKARA